MAEIIKSFIGYIKGQQGEPGEKGDQGDIGATGPRGSGWTQGMAITGTDTTGAVFPESGIADALVNDNYLNTNTGNTYRCILGGDASTAEWVYTGNLKGPKGEAPDISSTYVKKTDYATTEYAGIVKPDGKTIKIGEEGEIVGASSGFTGTKEEYEAAYEAGEIEVGSIVNITDDYSPGGSGLPDTTIGGELTPIYLDGGLLKAMSSTAGSATKPIYLNEGTVEPCTYSLEKTVPSNAIFTDTTYSEATTTTDGLMSANDKATLNGIPNTYAKKSLYGDNSVNVGRVVGSTVGVSSFTLGVGAEASGNFSYAMGSSVKASGAYAHATGINTTASGSYSYTMGLGTTANNSVSCAIGKYNASMIIGPTAGHAFVIGSGALGALKNAFSVLFNGTVKAASTITASTTADYAEFFEWLDGNILAEDRVGRFVTLEGNKIRFANEYDEYVLGIVSGEPFVLGNGDCDVWNGMVMRDEFGRVMYEPAPKTIQEEITEEIEREIEEIDKVTGEITPKTIKETVVVGQVEREEYDEYGNLIYEGEQPIINPDYNPDEKYISRFERPEWSPVGMLGVLSVYDDGTCEVNGYCKCNNDSIATKSDKGYRVIQRMTSNIIRVVFR